MSLINAAHLHKRYGNHHALDDFSMSVDSGRIVGLIGPNGSGKTTALKSMLGLARLQGGDLQVLGLDPYRDRAELMRRTTYVADVGILPRWMRISDLLAHVAAVNPAFDRERAEIQLAKTDIRIGKKVRTLSKGMTVQLHLALVLATDVELLVLDEPTLGLDILYRQAFYDGILNDYFEEQRSIVITTHEVSEVEHILTDVVFIHRGRNVLTTAMDDIPQRFRKVTAGKDDTAALQALAPLSLRQTLQGVTAIYDGVDTQTLSQIGTVATPNLTDLFVAVVGGMQ
ncbi:MAG: ABC transporter ATP-binding protein [Pseudomonadales bacterium]